MDTHRRGAPMISEIRNDPHGTGRGGRTGVAARARLTCMALPCVAAMAAMSPMAARAQVHVSNDVRGNTFVDGTNQGTSSNEATFHLVQPFTTPAGSGGIPLGSVVLHFTSMPLATSEVKLYLYRGKANPNPTNPPSFAPTVPDSGTVDETTNEPESAGRIAEFATPTRLGGHRYGFAAPGNTVLAANTTYHLYLWSVANKIGPTWRAVDIANTSGGTPGDASFTGNTFPVHAGRLGLPARAQRQREKRLRRLDSRRQRQAHVRYGDRRKPEPQPQPWPDDYGEPDDRRDADG